MISTSLAFLASACLAAAPASQKDLAKEDLAKLQGNWEVHSIEAAGQKLPDIKLEKLVINGNKIEGWDDMVFKIDPTKKPKEIDLILEKSGKVWKGIYSLDGDKLLLCMALVEMGKGE
jgi:uncharacterized protein (TIGR03067 family)